VQKTLPILGVTALGLGLPLAMAFAGTGGCNVYDTSLILPSTVPQGKGIGFWSGKVGKCDSAGVPRESDRPAPTSDADLAPFYLALSTLDLGERGPDGKPNPNVWQTQGFDLDGVCTNSPTCNSGDSIPVSCKNPGTAIPFDGDYCRDNTFGRFAYQAAVVPEVAKKYGLNADNFNCSLCIGSYNFIVRISQYNGKATDAQVRVDLYPSPGLESVLPWDCRSDDWKTHPCFTPDMPWKVQEDVLKGPRNGNELPDSKIATLDAYVRNGYLISALPNDTLFWFPGRNAIATAFPLRMQSSLFTGKLVRSQEGTWTVEDGMIAGRSKGTDIVKGFRQIGLCESDPSYSLISSFVNTNLDITASGVVDPNVPCDSLSFGIGFTAKQAKPGKLEAVAPLEECKTPSPSGDAGVGDAASD
jgi:hypothetical protein